MNDLFTPLDELEKKRLQEAGWVEEDYQGVVLWRAPDKTTLKGQREAIALLERQGR